MVLMIQAVHAFSSTKFVEWFPQDPVEFDRFRQSWTQGACKDLYADFVYKDQGKCGDVLNCLLTNTSEVQKTTIASAQVVMTLIPSLLATVGNSVAEVSLLASQRPLLSFLITLGAPSMHPTRIPEYRNPLHLLDGTSPHNPLDFGPLVEPSPSIRTVIYIIAAGATVNNIELALRIGSRSALAWGCRSWYMPLVWVLFPITTYAVAALSCCLSRKDTTSDKTMYLHTWSFFEPVEDALSYSLQCVQICFHIPFLDKTKPPSREVMLFQLAASCLAFAHVVLGTLILSSLIFVGFDDTLVILARFLGSAVVARIIMLLQLDGMRPKIASDDSRLSS